MFPERSLANLDGACAGWQPLTADGGRVLVRQCSVTPSGEWLNVAGASCGATHGFRLQASMKVASFTSSDHSFLASWTSRTAKLCGAVALERNLKPRVAVWRAKREVRADLVIEFDRDRAKGHPVPRPTPRIHAHTPVAIGEQSLDILLAP